MRDVGFADVLSVEAMLADLHAWQPPAWTGLVGRHRGWTDELFDFMAEGRLPPPSPTGQPEG